MMKVVELRDPAHLRPRAHPWTVSESDASHRYYDFRAHPERIRDSIEDLEPWRAHSFAETFFLLLEWLNGPDSLFESNDCAFSGVGATLSGQSKKGLEASGRLMILYRNLATNQQRDRVGGLAEALAYALSGLELDLEHAAVGVSIVETQFTTLAGDRSDQLGQQLMLSFWAWGDDEEETLHNLNRLLHALSAALRTVSHGLRGFL